MILQIAKHLKVEKSKYGHNPTSLGNGRGSLLSTGTYMSSYDIKAAKTLQLKTI